MAAAEKAAAEKAAAEAAAAAEQAAAAAADEDASDEEVATLTSAPMDKQERPRDASPLRHPELHISPVVGAHGITMEVSVDDEIKEPPPVLATGDADGAA